MSMPADRPIRVLIVDDSAVVRQILTRELARDPRIEVVGSAADAFIARDKIQKLQPDVLTLDIEMPRMDGVTFLRKLMAEQPLRVIVLSSLAEPGAQAALDALACGALEVLPKPQGDLQSGLTESIAVLIEHIKAVAHARLPERRFLPRARPASTRKAAVRARSKPVASSHLIAIGASTGGTEALKTVLSDLPEDTPGIAAVIHMPEGFTRRYAERLNLLCRMEVREAADGDELHSGLVLLGRGGQHLVIESEGGRRIARLRAGPPVNRHRPSIDVLFHSVVSTAGNQSMGVLLTGMGADGADGLLALRNAGGRTIVQDEATSVVFGMPKVAIERGAAEQVAPLGQIGECIQAWSRQRVRDPQIGNHATERKS